MKLFVGGLIVLVVGKYAVSLGYHMGPITMILLWCVVAWLWPKHVVSPLHVGKKYGKRLFRIALSRRVRMPFFGWVVYLTMPVALPLFLFIWLWTANYRYFKGPAPLGRAEA